jgi:DNA-binding Lrp family transcriptional regulator
LGWCRVYAILTGHLSEVPMPSQHARGLDALDLKILALLQEDGRSTIKKLAQAVGLSARPCLERVRRLQAAGIITAYRAVIDLSLLSRPVTVFAEFALASQAQRAAVETRLGRIAEAVECWEISGASDYLIRFVCADIARYEALTAELLGDRTLGIVRILSHVALRPVRPFTGYPTTLLAPRAD